MWSVRKAAAIDATAKKAEQKKLAEQERRANNALKYSRRKSSS